MECPARLICLWFQKRPTETPAEDNMFQCFISSSSVAFILFYAGSEAPSHGEVR